MAVSIAVGLLSLRQDFMGAFTKSVGGFSVRSAASVLFAIAGVAFFWGGYAIHEFAGTERLLAEMEGVGIAVIVGGVGVWVKSVEEDIARPEDEVNPIIKQDSFKK